MALKDSENRSVYKRNKPRLYYINRWSGTKAFVQSRTHFLFLQRYGFISIIQYLLSLVHNNNNYHSLLFLSRHIVVYRVAKETIIPLNTVFRDNISLSLFRNPRAVAPQRHAHPPRPRPRPQHPRQTLPRRHPPRIRLHPRPRKTILYILNRYSMSYRNKKGHPLMKMSPCAQSLQIIEPLLMTYIRFLNLWNGIKNGVDK